MTLKLVPITETRCGSCEFLVPIDERFQNENKEIFCCPQNRSLYMEVPFFAERCARFKHIRRKGRPPKFFDEWHRKKRQRTKKWREQSMGDYVCPKCGASYGEMTKRQANCPNCGEKVKG